MEHKSIIMIYCKDNTKRRIQVIGNWNSTSAISLAKDIEGSNYLSCIVE